MPQRYQSHASQIFQIHSASNADINLITLSFADDIDHIRLVSNEPIHYRRGDRENRCEMMCRRLASRTKGLLEAGPQTSGPESPKVQYLHRTVRDYFSIPQVWNDIVSMADATFDPHFALVATFCASLKTREPCVWDLLDNQSGPTLDQLTFSLLKCRPENHAALVPVLDAFDQFVSLNSTGIIRRNASPYGRFLPIGVVLDLSFWVEPTLRRELASTNTASLWACFGEVLQWHSRYKVRCIRTVRTLLEFAVQQEKHRYVSDAKRFVLEIARRRRDTLNTWQSDEALDLLERMGIELLGEYPYYRQKIGPIKRVKSLEATAETSAEQHHEERAMLEHDSEGIEADIPAIKRQKLM